MTVPVSPFAELGIAPVLIDRLGERNIRTPMAIQSMVIPRLFEGANVLFRSATGTGKTFAYLIPLVQRLLAPEPYAGSDSNQGEGTGERKRGASGILICAPTHELCAQIKGEADFLLAGSPFKAVLIIGSANISRQIDELKRVRPRVIIGNPSRLLQLARMGKLKLQDIGFLVLDEGDRLTADEMLEETGKLLNLVNSQRLTVSCSATLSPKSRERLLPLMGDNAIVLETEDQEILRERIQHWALFSENRRKISVLRSLLSAARPRKALVFTDRGGQVGNIVSQLQYHGLGAAGLHSDMNKKYRKQALDDFRRERSRVLVTSDLAARGLDIPGISHVIALDVPLTGDAYIHRAGRTGRAGQKGIMITIGDETAMRSLAAMEKKLGIVVYPKVLWKGRIEAPLPPEP